MMLNLVDFPPEVDAGCKTTVFTLSYSIYMYSCTYPVLHYSLTALPQSDLCGSLGEFCQTKRRWILRTKSGISAQLLLYFPRKTQFKWLSFLTVVLCKSTT